MTEHKNITDILTKYMSFKIPLITAMKEDNNTVPNIYPKNPFVLINSELQTVFLHMEQRISTSTFGAGKCHLTPPM